MRLSRSLLGVLLLFLAAACGDGDKKLSLGGSCTLNSDCKDPLVCKLGGCHQACMQSRDCPTGERCVKVDGMGVCQQQTESACVHGGPVTCKPPLVCAADNACRNSCTTGGDCAGSQECVANVCLEAAEAAAWRTDGGAGLDGGTSIGPDGGGGPDAIPVQPDLPAVTSDVSTASRNDGSLASDALKSIDIASAESPRNADTLSTVDAPAVDDALQLDGTTSGEAGGPTVGPVSTDRLAAYFPLDGHTNDLSGNNNIAKNNGGTYASDRFGNPASACSLDGVSDYLRIEDSPSLDFGKPGESFSVAFWINTTETRIDRQDWNIIDKYSGTKNTSSRGYPFKFSIYQGGESFYLARTETNAEQTSASVQARPAPNDGKWHLIAGICDKQRNVLEIYVDGVLRDSTEDVLGATNKTGQPILFGLSFLSYYSPFYSQMVLDDLYFYNRPLSAGEVTALYEDRGWGS